MNDASRKAFAYFAIAGALCAGAHYLFVEPRLRELGQAQTEVVQLTADLEQAKALPQRIDSLLAIEKAIAEQASKIRVLSEPAMNESVLFSKVMALGQSTGVRVDRLDAARGSAAPNAVATGPATERSPTVVRYSIGVMGSYADIARFTRGLQEDLGYCKVRQMQLNPATTATADGTTANLTATIETEHLAFDPSPLPEAVSGQDAQADANRGPGSGGPS